MHNIYFILHVHAHARPAGRPSYGENSSIASISDVGATEMGLFIALCSATAVFMLLTAVAYLGRVEAHTPPQRDDHNNNVHVPIDAAVVDVDLESPTWKAWPWLAGIVFIVISSISLILLSIFSVSLFETTHWVFAITFFVTFLAFAIVIGVGSDNYCQRRELDVCRISRVIRWIILGLSVPLAAVAFAFVVACWSSSSDSCYSLNSIAAVFEWVIGFLFGLYALTLAHDLFALRNEGHNRERREAHPANDPNPLAIDHVR